MLTHLLTALLFIGRIGAILGDVTAGADGEQWGYVDVRENAHVFWWLYHAQDSDSKPLIIWLQGGPGAGGSGYGNFLEIGPLDMNLQPRNSTWLQLASLLFIDNPAGAGFSYVDDPSAYATSTKQIGHDLLTTIIAIFKQVPELQTRPLWIFGESYGGKYTSVFSPILLKAIADNKITCDFRGIALGDSWISPPDYSQTYAPYYYAMSFLNDKQLKNATVQNEKVQQAISTKDYRQATQEYLNLHDLLQSYTNYADYYDIRRTKTPIVPGDMYNTESQITRFLITDGTQELTDFMNTEIREKLNIIPDDVSWGKQSTSVFKALFEDFMKPVYSCVDKMLKQGKLHITAYNGQLDALVSTIGVLRWIGRLTWDGATGFQAAPKVAHMLANTTSGFQQTHSNFNFFTFLQSGHLIQQPEAAFQMLRIILSQN